jgi:hypothetical protein
VELLRVAAKAARLVNGVPAKTPAASPWVAAYVTAAACTEPAAAIAVAATHIAVKFLNFMDYSEGFPEG